VRLDIDKYNKQSKTRGTGRFFVARCRKISQISSARLLILTHIIVGISAHLKQFIRGIGVQAILSVSISITACTGCCLPQSTSEQLEAEEISLGLVRLKRQTIHSSLDGNFGGEPARRDDNLTHLLSIQIGLQNMISVYLGRSLRSFCSVCLL